MTRTEYLEKQRSVAEQQKQIQALEIAAQQILTTRAAGAAREFLGQMALVRIATTECNDSKLAILGFEKKKRRLRSEDKVVRAIEARQFRIR